MAEVDDELEPEPAGPQIDVEGIENLSDDERKKRASGLSDDIARRYDPSRLTQVVVDQAGRGEQLDFGLQSSMEKRLGASFQHVRVIRGQFADDVTRAHRADAITVANTGMILVRESARSDPGTALGKALMAHELTHVAQAQRGLQFALEGGESGEGDHEAAAEAVEHEVAKEEGGGGHEKGGGGGGGGHGKGGGGKGKDLGPQVIARCMEMMREHARLVAMRNGNDDHGT